MEFLQNRDRDTLLGTYAKPRPRHLTGNVCKTETETPYWELIQNRDRDALLETYTKPRPRRLTGNLYQTETETVGGRAPPVPRMTHLIIIALEPL